MATSTTTHAATPPTATSAAPLDRVCKNGQPRTPGHDRLTEMAKAYTMEKTEEILRADPHGVDRLLAVLAEELRGEVRGRWAEGVGVVDPKTGRRKRDLKGRGKNEGALRFLLTECQ